MCRVVRHLLTVVLFFAWSALLLGQTAIDLPNDVQDVPCNGASINGVFTCTITGVLAGDTIVACVENALGTLTPTVTETNQSATVTDIPGADQLSASGPALYQGMRYIPNAAGGTYIFSSNNGGGGGNTTAQSIVLKELGHVAAAPLEAGANHAKHPSSATIAPATTTTNPQSVSEIAVTCSGTASNITTIVPNVGLSTAWTIPTAAKELTLPGMAVGNAIIVVPKAGLGGASFLTTGANMTTTGASGGSLTATVSFIGSNQPTVQGYGDTQSDQVQNTTSAADMGVEELALNDCGLVHICVLSSNTITSPVCAPPANANSLCTGSGTGLGNTSQPCCTGVGTGTCPNNNANWSCGGAGSPSPCCTGVGTGTCQATVWTNIFNKSIADNTGCASAGLPVPCCTGLGTGSCILTDLVFMAPQINSDLVGIPGTSNNNIACTLDTTGSVGAMNNTGLHGWGKCAVFGTPNVLTGSGATATGPSDAGAANAQWVFIPDCHHSSTVSAGPGNLNPLLPALVSSTQTNAGLNSTDLYTIDWFYPVTKTGTMPAQVWTAAATGNWAAGEMLLASPTATPTPAPGGRRFRSSASMIRR